MLILGGTGEAARLARRLAATRPALEVTTSLAGATRRPAAIAGRVRRGGFGGVEGLAAHLRAGPVGALVDATHPFAARMAAQAEAAARATGTARLKLLRPMWPRVEGDRWIEVGDSHEAARAVATLGAGRVFLTLGRRGLAAFGALKGVRFAVRTIEPAEPPLADAVRIVGRGPFAVEDEMRLLRRHGIDCVVAKASGGRATRGKIDAARALGLPVVLLRRPPPPPGPVARDVEDALAWIDERLEAGRADYGRGGL